jgi:hypothetical protein
LVILFSALRSSNKPITVEEFLLPAGFRLPHDVSECYEMHQQLLDSLLALNSDLQKENPSIKKLNKPEPKQYAPLKIDGNTFTLLYEGGRMDGMERDEDYKILLNGEKIYDFKSRAPVPIDHIHGFFTWKNLLRFYAKKNEKVYFVNVIVENLKG